MTQPTDGLSAAHAAGDVKLKVFADPKATLTDEEARAWLAQPVAPSGRVERTIDAEEVQGG